MPDVPVEPPEVGEPEPDEPEVGAGAPETEGVPLVGPAVATAPTPPVWAPLSEICERMVSIEELVAGA